MAVEQLWIRAGQHQLGVQPVSPVFLYARSDTDLKTLSEEFTADLQRPAAPLPVHRRARRTRRPRCWCCGSATTRRRRRPQPAAGPQRSDVNDRTRRQTGGGSHGEAETGRSGDIGRHRLDGGDRADVAGSVDGPAAPVGDLFRGGSELPAAQRPRPGRHRAGRGMATATRYSGARPARRHPVRRRRPDLRGPGKPVVGADHPAQPTTTSTRTGSGRAPASRACRWRRCRC